MDRSFRVPPPTSVRVAVGRPGDVPVPCEIDDMTVDGARIDVTGTRTPHLVVGRPAVLQLIDVGSGLALDLAAEVMGRHDDAVTRHYRLRFVDPTVVSALLDPHLARAFNRRRPFRARPRRDERIEVTIEAPPAAGLPLTTATLLDLSTTGIGLRVPRRFEAGMALHSEVELLFLLPGAQTPTALRGDIRNRELEEHGVRYGIVFLAQDTPQHELQIQQILGWVLQRQREDLGGRPD